MKLRYLKYLIAASICISMYACVVRENENEWEKMIDFEDNWKFSIGDDMLWAKADYDDSGWEHIRVPSPWENEGYHGYDGYAWYRNEIIIPSKLKDRTLFLSLGAIDDVDEVYFNGHLIGFTGSFPPRYETAYNVFRRYPIPAELINYSRRNTVAVRVYDAQLGGGIMSGELGVFVLPGMLEPELSLTGKWNFRPGDNPDWKETEVSYHDWDEIMVPGFWEAQGFFDYDGFAWYRKEFNVKDDLASKKLILLMGRIDDFDEVYINGKLAGSTGNIEEVNFNGDLGSAYQQQRNYFLPQGMIKPGRNVIAVRVYDGFKDGGIYKGPIGLISQEKFTQYWKDRKE